MLHKLGVKLLFPPFPVLPQLLSVHWHVLLSQTSFFFASDASHSKISINSKVLFILTEVYSMSNRLPIQFTTMI